MTSLDQGRRGPTRLGGGFPSTSVPEEPKLYEDVRVLFLFLDGRWWYVYTCVKGGTRDLVGDLVVTRTAEGRLDGPFVGGRVE